MTGALIQTIAPMESATRLDLARTDTGDWGLRFAITSAPPTTYDRHGIQDSRFHGRGRIWDLWRVLTDQHPEIEEFRDLARKTNADPWVDASTRLVDSLSKLREGTAKLARAQDRNFSGIEPTFYDRFGTHVGRVSSSLGSIASVAQKLVDPFHYLADKTREVGEEFEHYLSTVDALDDITDDVSVREPFNELAALIEGIPAPIREFIQRVRPLHEHFSSVKGTATGHKRTRIEDWEARREANRKVRLLSSGAVLLGFLAFAEHWSVPLDVDGEK